MIRTETLTMNSAATDPLDAATIVAALGARSGELHVEVVEACASTNARLLERACGERPVLLAAELQTAGRGRRGRRWHSPRGAGLTFSIARRMPQPVSGLTGLSLAAGVAVARTLRGMGAVAVALKWPNDVVAGGAKLGGILVEARWRDQRPDWVAIGLGVNIAPPADVPSAAGLRPTATRLALLEVLVPVLRVAAEARGPLSSAELADFAARDYARGRRCARPARGVVQGITSDGALIIESAGGVAHYRGGSLEFAGEEREAP